MRERGPVVRAVSAFLVGHEPEMPGDAEPVYLGGDRAG